MAQSLRMNRLIEIAQTRLAAVEAGQSLLTDDEPFIVYRGDAARILQMDPSIHHQTVLPQKLLRNNGTISTQIVESVRIVQPQLREQNATLGSGTLFLTLRSFLSANAVKSISAMEYVDYCSTNNSTICAVQK